MSWSNCYNTITVTKVKVTTLCTVRFVTPKSVTSVEGVDWKGKEWGWGWVVDGKMVVL